MIVLRVFKYGVTSALCVRCHAEKISAKNIHDRLQKVFGKAAMPPRTVRSWVQKFKAGRENVHDDDRMRQRLVFWHCLSEIGGT